MERAEKIKWFAARARFLPLGEYTQDLALGLELARDCRHPDAVWLCSLFPNGPPASPQDARYAFLQHAGDARALCFAALVVEEILSYHIKIERLQQAADMGDALAQAMASTFSHWDPGSQVGKLEWTKRAAAEPFTEPQALFDLGHKLRYGKEGFSKDHDQAKLC